MPLRHAYLILCHKNVRQINLLTGLLESAHADIFVHMDARMAALVPELLPRQGLRVCARHRIVWGGFEMVRATLDLMRQAAAAGPYAYVHLLSGQCLPLWPEAALRAHFEAGLTQTSGAPQYMDCAPFPVLGLPMQGLDRILVPYAPEMQGRLRGARARQREAYVEQVLRTPALHRRIDHLPRLYHGSQWFSVTGEFVHFALQAVQTRPELAEFFSASHIPDEMFFQTIMMDSPFVACVTRATWRYMDWIKGGPHTFSVDDLPEVLHSEQGLARKFDTEVDETAVARVAAITRLRTAYPDASPTELLAATGRVFELAQVEHFSLTPCQGMDDPA